MSFTIEIADEQNAHSFDTARLTTAAEAVLTDAGIHQAEISIAIVSGERMHELNRQYLDHDYPTDVLSFLLDHDTNAASLSGQIIVSADYAAAEAARYGWTTDDELLLYVIHGCLHLVGHDDSALEGQRAMRAAESQYLRRFELEHRYEEPR
jgi:probable rRNA maturation factor